VRASSSGSVASRTLNPGLTIVVLFVDRIREMIDMRAGRLVRSRNR
jgi:hypothetical protein